MERSTQARAASATLVRGYVPALDGWRGLAILVVVLHNAGYVFDGAGSILHDLTRTALSAGWVGVSLFFVLSGFLITGILADTLGSTHFFRGFYVRRTLRIFPLYYGFLVAVFIALPLISWGASFASAAPVDHLWYWLYLSNWHPLLSDGGTGLSHLWSLAVEEQFYLIWPLALWTVGRDRFGAFALGLVAAAFLVRLGMFVTGAPPDHLYSFTITRMDALAIGAWMAVAARQHPAQLARFASGRAQAVAAGLLFVVVLAGLGLEPHGSNSLLFGQTLVAICFGQWMVSTLAPERPWQKALATAVDTRLLRTLGKYSYAIYVFHFPLEIGLRPTFSPIVNSVGGVAQVGAVLVYCSFILAMSTAMAVASWHLYEKHFLALKDRLAPRPSARVPIPMPPAP